MRHRVGLLQPISTPDTGGGASQAYQEVAEVWAEVRTPRVREDVVADGLVSRVTYAVRIRFRSDVRPDWRMRHAGRTLRVLGVRDVDGSRRFVEVSAEEDVA